MKRTKRLLAIVVGLGLVAPLTGYTDPQDRQGPEHPGGERQGGARQGPGGGEGRPSPAMHPQQTQRPAGSGATRGPAIRPRQEQPEAGQPRMGEPRKMQSQMGERTTRPRDVAPRPARPESPRPGNGGGRRPPATSERLQARPALGAWNRPASLAERNQAGQGWRQAHRGWDNQTVWRQNQNWWRSDRAFRLYSGVRAGFFFIPELGYVSAPPEYERHYWPAGDTLPRWFWRYTVGDYGRYGLPTPPYGCAWVWVDDDIALIDLSDGYILDVVRNVW